MNEWYIGEATVVFIFVGAFLFVCLARHIWAKNGDVCTKWMCFHKPIGSGPDKIFCKQHAQMSEKGRGRMKARVADILIVVADILIVVLIVFIGYLVATAATCAQATKQPKPPATQNHTLSVESKTGDVLTLVPSCKSNEVYDALWRCVAKPLPPMVAPTKRDVVTHSTELACPKGYEMGQLDWSEEKTIGSWWTFPVCVTPAFIEELRKAAADK